MELRDYGIGWFKTNPVFFSDLLSGIGSAVGGALGLIGQSQTNAMNQAEVQQQENYQTQMSDTAHQREVQDLEAAGLNPILSANSGASTPSGAMTTMTSPLNSVANSAANIVSDVRAGDAQISQNRILKNQEQSSGSNAVIADQHAQQELNNTAISGINARIASNTEDAITEQAIANSDLDRNSAKISNKVTPLRMSLAPASEVIGLGGQVLHGANSAISSGKMIQSMQPSTTVEEHIIPGTGEIYKQRNVTTK